MSHCCETIGVTSVSCRIKHLSKRNGTYYYSRRLPEVGMANANLHQAIFGGASHYRVSLGTKIQAEALARFNEADQHFREKLALVVPDRGGGQAISKPWNASGSILRSLTMILSFKKPGWADEGNQLSRVSSNVQWQMLANACRRLIDALVAGVERRECLEPGNPSPALRFTPTSG